MSNGYKRGEKLPLTPLHYPVAYVLHSLQKKLILPGLTVGSMFPDLEIPIVFLFLGTDRLVLHSLLGAVTIGTLLSILCTVLIYPILVRYIFRIDKVKVIEKIRPTLTLIFSCLLGNLSHVLLDCINHLYNPLFWPLSSPTLSPVCEALGGLGTSFWILHVTLMVLLVTLVITQRDNLWEKLLVGE